MSQVRLCFQKGPRAGRLNNLLGKIGARLDRGPYHHVEIQLPSGISVSASHIENRVRLKQIDYDAQPNQWSFVNVPEWLHRQVRTYASYHLSKGTKYDWRGNLHFAFGAIEDDPDKLFCSEFAAGAIGLPEPWRWAPNGLFTITHYLFAEHQ